MKFDINAARSSGYSDDEIADYLATENKFDLSGALKSGYSASDVIGFLSGAAAAPAETVTDTGDETARLAARYKAPEKPGVVARVSSALPKPVDPLGIGSGRPLGAPRAQEPAKPPKAPTPYRDRREALDDAVNLLEEGADQKAVTEAFSKGGIKFNEIVDHGRKRGSEYFKQQPGMGVVDPEVSRLANRFPAPVTGEIKASDYVPKATGLQRVEDLGREFAGGAIAGFKGIADVTGVDNEVGEALGKAREIVLRGRSGQAKAVDGLAAMIMEEAQNKGLWDQIQAGGEAFLLDPLKNTAQGAGSVVPSVIGSKVLAGSKIVQGIGNVGSRLLGGTGGAVAASRAGGAITGGAMGVGMAKSQIYETVEKDALDSGYTKEEARSVALKAQEYSRNPAVIFGVGALGLVSGGTGVESAIARMMGRTAVKELATSGVIKSTAKGVLAEFPLEFAQGGSEAFAGNVASRGEGFDVGLTRGVGTSATMEGLSGGVLGAGVGAIEGVVNRANDPARQLARELDVSIANTDFTSAEPVARARLDPNSYDLSLVSPAQTARSVADVGPSAPLSFTPVGAPTQEAGLVDIVVPTAPETTDVSTLGATGGQLDLRSPAGSDQLGGGLGLPRLDVDGTRVLSGGDAGLPAADAGANVLAGSPAGQPTPGIALPRVAARATDQDLLARTEAAIAAPENNNAVVEPTEQWFGRKGDGYSTQADASQAIGGRQRMFPTLEWKVEEMPSGKFRLAGYEQQNTQPAPTMGTMEAGAGTPQPTQAAPITAAAPQAVEPITAPSGAPFSTAQTATVFARQNGITDFTTQPVDGGFVIQPAAVIAPEVEVTPAAPVASTPAAAEPITAPSGKPFSTEKTAAVYAQQNGITGYSTVKMDGGWAIKPMETTLGTQTPQAIQGQTQGQAPALSGAASPGVAGGLQLGDAAQTSVPEIAGAATPGVADNARQLASAQPELGQPLAASASEGERAAVVGGPLFASKVKSAPISVIKLARDYTARQSGVEFAPVSSNKLSEQQRAASLMATLSGQTVTFIEQTAGDQRAMPNGLAIGGKHVMIDVKSEDAPLAVAMHEVVHNMPDNIRKPLEGALRNLFKSGMEGDFKTEFNYDDADLDKEIPAMITQAVTKRKDFWNELRQEMGNKDFSAVAELIITRLDNWVRGVRTEYGDGFINKYVTDVEQARSLISKAYAQSMREQGLQPDPVLAPAPTRPKAKRRESSLQKAAYNKNPLLTLLAKHGLRHDRAKMGSLKSEFSPDRQIMVSGYGPVFKKSGKQLDELLTYAIEDGYLPPNADESDLYNLINRAVSGERIAPTYSEQGMNDMEAEFAAQLQARYEEREDQPDEQWYGQDEADYVNDMVSELTAMSTDDFAAMEAAIDDLMDAPSGNMSTRDAMEALGFTEEEIQDEERRDAAKADEVATEAQSRGAAPSQGAAQSEGLTTYSPKEIEVLEKARAKREGDQKKADTAADQKAKADAEVGDFTLTGSDRAADVGAAQGQDPMFSNRSGKDTTKAEAIPAGEALIAIHNLTPENLLYADEIGGLPVPSIGVTKAASPFYAFGNITLLAPKGMVDPATGTPVFDRDAYTSRFPELNYKKVPSKRADAFYAEMDELRNVADDGDAFSRQTWEAMTGTGASPSKLLDLFGRYNAPKMEYIKTVLGKSIKVPMRDVALNSPASRDREVIKFLRDNEGALKGRDGFTNDQYKTALADLKDVVLAAVDRYVDKKYDDEDRRATMAKMLKKSVLDSDGDLSARSYQVLMQDMKNVGKKQVDVAKLSDQIRKLVPRDDPAYMAWAKSKTAGLFDQPTITLRGKQVAPTLDNIVDAMTVGGVAGVEKTMTSGTGKISAMLGKRFKSLNELKAARNQVVSTKQEGESKSATEDTLNQYRDKAVQFFTERNYRGEIDTWAGLDASMEALAVAGKGALTDGNVRVALQRKGFRGVDQETIDLAKQGVEALRSAVTDYFEAKPQRAVALSEFRGAVVPKGLDAKALEVLAKNNVETVEFNPKKEGDREAKLQKLAKKLDKAEGDIMFSRRVLEDRIGVSQLSYQGYVKAEVPRVQAARKMAGILAKLDAGTITPQEFELQVRVLSERLAEVSATKDANRIVSERARGADIVREKLIAARRRGEVDSDTTEFALWALQQNPAIAEGLGISVREQPENQRGAAGDYNPAAAIMRVFKGSANTGTAVHEILHHTERMMPEAVQTGIRKEWSKAYVKALGKAEPKQRAALEKMLEAMAGSQAAQTAVREAFSDGTLKADVHYQLVNPSEFWAVNATDILQRRYEAGSWIGKAKQWLSEMVQTAKGLVGMRSNAPVLRGLEAVLSGDGERQSKKMLSEGDVFEDIGASRTEYEAIVAQYKDTEQWLKAPNGARSSLTERQWVQVRTPSFKAWFGDWENDPTNASKIIDSKGEPQVYYHGSTEAGFTEFDVGGKGETRGTGAFFADNFAMARGYSGSREDAPVYRAEQILADPELIDGLEVEEGILVEVTNSRGDKTWDWFADEEAATAELEPDEGETLATKPGYRVGKDGYEEMVGDRDEVLEFLDTVRGEAAGVYEVFINARDLVTIEWNGNNWDDGPKEAVWRIEDQDGDLIDFVYTQEEADAAIERDPNSTAEREDQAQYESTNDAARQGRDMDADGTLIKDVTDTGPFGYSEDGNVLIVYKPENIKSADVNTGAFDPTDADIRRSNRQSNLNKRQKLSTIGQNFELPSTSNFDAARIKLQDDALRMKRVIEAVKAKGGTVGEAQNFYDANTLMPGRVQATMDDFRDNVMRPLIDKAVSFGIDMDELALYAYAKHAEERNAYIASINKRMPDGGSGMTDAHAKSILQLAKLSGDEAKFEELHRDLMAITSTTRQVMLAEGLISQEEFNALDGSYENYIPLRGLENVDENTGAMRPGVGRGINVRGGETIKALGRKSQAGDLIENVIRDYQRVIMRVEKNDVGKVLLDFVLSNPDPDLWGVDVERSKPSLNKATGLVQYTKNIEKGEDTIGVKVGGEQVYIKLADAELARAIRQAWKDEVSGLERVTLAVSGWWNNWLRNVLTRYNPAFAAINIPRDALWSGTSAALAELGPKGLVRYLANYGKAFMASSRQEAGMSGSANKFIGNQSVDQVFQEFRSAGAITGGFYMRSLEDINTDLRNEMLLAGAKAKNTFEVIKSLPPYKLATMTARMLEFMGSASENATRFALYQAAKDVGRTPAQAALLAKDGTTNFNRKGEWGGALNNMFLFFNASVQGTAQLVKVLRNPAVQASMAGVTGVGMMLALYGASAGGEDDDGEAYWDKIPSYVKERNLVYMLPPGEPLLNGINRVGKRGRYYTVPVQYGFNFFPNAGYMMADVLRNSQDPKRGMTPTKAALHMASVFFGSVNPVGGSIDFSDGEQVLLAVMPTLIDPLVQVITERNTFGSPSSPFKSPWDARPDSERMFTSQQNSVSAKIAEALNELGGGNEGKAGKILGVETSVAPGTIQTLISATTGGLGSFVEQVGSSIIAMTGDSKDLKAAKVPFLNKFYGEVDEGANIQTARERMDRVRKISEEIKAQQRVGIDPETTLDEKKLLELANVQQLYQERQSLLRKNELEIIKDKTLTEPERKLKLKNIQMYRDQEATEANKDFLQMGLK